MQTPNPLIYGRVDRLVPIRVLDETFEPQPGQTLEDFFAAAESRATT